MFYLYFGQPIFERAPFTQVCPEIVDRLWDAFSTDELDIKCSITASFPER